MKQTTVFVVVRADGTARVHTKRRQLNVDEVAFPITISWPEGWATYRAALAVTMPEAPTVELAPEANA